MSQPKTPALGYALLGLLQQKPSSGYEIRKVFSSTSLKTYSDSPGAIYPALRRLEQQGLIRGTIEEGSGLRRRQIFRVTSRGFSQLKKWIRAPITPDDLIRGQEEIMLRFAFSETAVGPAASLELLRSLQVALKPYLASLHKEFGASAKLIPMSGRLAFESGIRGAECLLQWTRYAIHTYEKATHRKGSAS
ncbi:MAG TPA: PadR family transcriptional regulator [Candidatus Dormibacteraeota bacterium]|nr:PadR family transcriptional regulator [Candidatus Dormibacteraeota bacterium]